MTRPQPTASAEDVEAERDRVRETYAAMRARVPQHDLWSAREEFDDWLAAYVQAARDEERARAANAVEVVLSGSAVVDGPDDGDHDPRSLVWIDVDAMWSVVREARGGAR